MKDVDAEARKARNAVRQVELAVELEALLLLGGQDPVEERADRLGIERGPIDCLQVPAHANTGRRADREMQVGGPPCDGLFEQSVNRQRNGFHDRSYRQRSGVCLSIAHAG